MQFHPPSFDKTGKKEGCKRRVCLRTSTSATQISEIRKFKSFKADEEADRPIIAANNYLAFPGLDFTILKPVKIGAKISEISGFIGGEDIAFPPI
jgi:hypothetical protein